MSESRIKNSKQNIISGIIKQIVNLLFGFAIRTVILYSLGAEYQGLSGLFTSIISVLNLSDLGFSTAVIFILYKPIAERNNDAICAIVNFLKKIYFYVGVFILTAGIAIMPFLKQLISSDAPNDINLYILYLIYLLNASVSYMLFAYKSALLTAMQRQDIENKIYTYVTIGIKVLQFSILLLSKNYYLYAITIPTGTIINNIFLEIESKKVFPHIIPKGAIPKETRDVFVKQIKAVFLGKIGDVARNSFDNIVISYFLGLIAVAVYDNYYFVYTALYAFMGIIIRGISASVGNSIATTSVSKNYNNMQIINFIFMWIVGWCSICMMALYQPFMFIWMKGNPSMILDTFDMILFCVYFYCINMTYVRSMYLDGNGLFYECRLYFILEALGNLALNFLLGYLWGITGILLATIITIVVLNFVCRTNVLFKYYYKDSPFQFYKQHIHYAVVTTVACSINYYLCGLVKITGFEGLILRLSVCVVVPNFIYLICYMRSNLFKDSFQLVKRTIIIGE